MARRARARSTRKRVFVACEGESERGYAGFLWELGEEIGLSLHFDLQICPGGDHLAVVQRAVATIEKPLSRQALRAKFGMAHVQRAAGTNPGLLEFLREMGFPDLPFSRSR